MLADAEMVVMIVVVVVVGLHEVTESLFRRTWTNGEP